jgi:methylmalonyl-CoA/ethylmalonyl-CoA epimerase
MHHIGFRLEDAAEYEAAMQHYRDSGIVEAMSGWFHAPGGNCKWTYVDTRASIGCYTELYYVDGVALQAFEDFRDGRSDDFIPGAPNSRQMPKVA